MRKFIFIVLSLLMVFLLTSGVYAGAATKARTALVGNGIDSVNGVGDLSSGNTVEVDGFGSLQVVPSVGSIATNLTVSSATSPGDSQLLVTGACRVDSITISGTATSAGDYALIYDAATTPAATVVAKFEPSVGTAKDTRTIDTKGAIFSNGIWCDANSNSVLITVVYSQ
jgi:hypothetical protein